LARRERQAVRVDDAPGKLSLDGAALFEGASLLSRTGDLIGLSAGTGRRGVGTERVRRGERRQQEAEWQGGDFVDRLPQ
jgi:hypothetical protein